MDKIYEGKTGVEAYESAAVETITDFLIESSFDAGMSIALGAATVSIAATSTTAAIVFLAGSSVILATGLEADTYNDFEQFLIDMGIDNITDLDGVEGLLADVYNDIFNYMNRGFAAGNEAAFEFIDDVKELYGVAE